MENNTFDEIKNKLQHHPKQIVNVEEWILITINTAKAIIDTTAKDKIKYVEKFLSCETTNDMQQLFDTVQGKFGNNNFSQKHNPKYLYLCSLIARFPKETISNKDKKLIRDFMVIKKYFLYEI